MNRIKLILLSFLHFDLNCINISIKYDRKLIIEAIPYLPVLMFRENRSLFELGQSLVGGVGFTVTIKV